jgi:hypothetical protein
LEMYDARLICSNLAEPDPLSVVSGFIRIWVLD